MALDTRSKRASSVGIISFAVLSLVLPDGTIAAGDRQHIAATYSGIASSASIEVTPTPASLTITTYAPTVVVTTHYNAIPSPASLTITTYAPTVQVQGLPTTSVIYGGDDAPRKRKRQRTYQDLFHEIEQTIHQLIAPSEESETNIPPDSTPVPQQKALSQALDELVELAQGQHALLQQAAALQARLDALAEERRRRFIEEDEADWEWFL